MITFSLFILVVFFTVGKGIEQFQTQCECVRDQELMTCEGGKSPSILVLVRCPEAQVLLGEGFFLDIRNDYMDVFKHVILSSTTLTCEEVYRKILTSGATLNGEKCEENDGPHFRTSRPRPPAFPQDPDNDDDDDDDDNDEGDDQGTSSSTSSTTALPNVTVAGPVTRQPTSTQRMFVLVEDGKYTDYLRDWERVIDEGLEFPLHIMYCEDLKMNTERELDRLLKFLDIELSQTLKEDIINACSFQKMATEKRVISEKMVGKIFRKGVSFFRKGIIGDWKNLFTVAQNEMFEEIWKREMKDSKMFKFIYTDCA